MSDYKILRVIGKGAFGDAYLGIHLKQKKQYVIKQVQIKNKSKEQTDHIYHEVKLLQQFNHINIVSYRDSFIDKKGLLNIVMEYCQDGDMNQYIESLQGNKIPQDKIVYWLAQIALAILYMHQKKILHRDLKSPNIFILKGNIRLGDFGISKVLDHVRDLAQTNIGTPYYMSPEQYNHKPYSYKSDIWAFGCILYEMCNQRRPFEANNIQALGMKVVRGNFPPVSECYSKDLRNLIGDMLAKNPVKRPNIIEILLKPFVKKKLIQYMKNMYQKKDQISKQSLLTFLEQSKTLGIVLEQNKSVAKAHDFKQRQKQRSTSAKKKNNQEQKQKLKLQRQRKKQELEKQLNQHNKERKQMAQKLRKIQQQRKSILAKKKSEKNLKAIYEKVQANHQHNNEKQYKSQKYSNNSSKSDLKHEQNHKNIVQKLNKDKSITIQEKSNRKTESVQTDTPISVISTDRKNQQNIKKIDHNQVKKIIKNQWVAEKKPQKTFKMQEQYEMQFQDCQPQNNQQNYYDQFQQYQQSQEKIQQNAYIKNRLPTFASDQKKLAKQMQEIKHLVFESNQAVKQLSKHEPQFREKEKQQQKDKQKEKEKPIQEPIKKIQQKIEIVLNEQQKLKQHEKIQQKLQSLKQQIKMKTQHINSIRNQLSNIDFQLSDSDEQKQDQVHFVQPNYANNIKQVQKIKIKPGQPNFSKKKQYNPQHTKINDRINTLKQSAITILGSEKFNTFYDYLINITQKGRNVKRDYLQVVLGKQKIGAYHLVQQIVRLNRVLEKIPKWLN